MATRYIPYFPEPIEGQAILNNFTRTLKYYGNDKVKEKFDRIVKSFLEYKKYFCGDKRERVRTW